MTGYTVHTGSTEKFASGWDGIFRKAGGKAQKKAAKTKVSGKKKGKKK